MCHVVGLEDFLALRMAHEGGEHFLWESGSSQMNGLYHELTKANTFLGFVGRVWDRKELSLYSV